MIVFGLLWLLLGLATSAIYADRPLLGLRVRQFIAVCTALLSLAAICLLLVLDWRLWLVPAVFEAYKLVNLARFAAVKLPIPQLNSVVLRAHGWLISFQSVSFLLAWSVKLSGGVDYMIAVIACVQLLCALLLLRSSLHTWRHAEPFRRTAALTDRQLPALSVLIPARNETDSLRRCLECLVASDYPKIEIIVLDDASTTRQTPQIIRSFAHAGVRFIESGQDVSANWLAKNQAYDRLRQAASGQLLLFCGVDARFAPRTIRQLVETLEARQKDMLSVLPLRAGRSASRAALLQPMRYYWELCLPRRFFKRPPVLSTCWLVRAGLFDHAGGMAAVSRSVTPEAYFARQAVVHDAYSFIRSNAELGFYSIKPNSEQYATSVRTRYPQLHRRLELIALTAVAELLICIGPMIGLAAARLTAWPLAYGMIWAVATGCLLTTYYFVSVATRLNQAVFAWLLMPLAFLADIVMLHISMYKYEFSHVEWKGRDVSATVMRQLQSNEKSF